MAEEKGKSVEFESFESDADETISVDEAKDQEKEASRGAPRLIGRKPAIAGVQAPAGGSSGHPEGPPSFTISQSRS